MSAALLDTERPSDPGEHVIEATATGYLKSSTKVTLTAKPKSGHIFSDFVFSGTASTVNPLLFQVTVPVDVLPPLTVVGLSVSAERLPAGGAGVTVRAAVRVAAKSVVQAAHHIVRTSGSPATVERLALPAPALRPFITHYAGFLGFGLPPGTHVGLPSRDGWVENLTASMWI